MTFNLSAIDPNLSENLGAEKRRDLGHQVFKGKRYHGGNCRDCKQFEGCLKTPEPFQSWCGWPENRWTAK
jgi:hypothetical protein